MLTPSGRFETNTRLCLSMSDYHPGAYGSHIIFFFLFFFSPFSRVALSSYSLFSFSNNHNNTESWNPSWSVETLLVGLQSFMYEENNTAIGSVK